MPDEYYSTCSECEYIHHCFGRDIATQIITNTPDNDMYLRPDKCSNFYPEIKQK